MSKLDRSRVIRFSEAQAAIPGPGGEHSVSFLQRGTLNVKLSLPVPPNQQTPHAQDEIYVVIRGRGFPGSRRRAGPHRIRRSSVRDCGNRASFRGLYRGPRRVGCLLRPPWRRGSSLERSQTTGRNLSALSVPSCLRDFVVKGEYD
jgi:hypothetical protein